jgi:UDP-N-acetylglucosamine--N-acetylmuramyl-(pentapeptide) pyrophosphoryl-undecaprenol N-acetylglucosamine transferase
MRIIVATGASGGHIFPALSFLDTLKSGSLPVEALLLLPRKSAVIPEGCRVEYLSISNVKFKFDKENLSACFKLFKGCLESVKLLIEFKPDIVVGFGSINSLPVIFFAWLFRIKTLIHEQNVIPGKANLLLGKFADKICVSFNQTAEYFGNNKERVVFTGNPLRRALKITNKAEALRFFGFKEDKFTVLVMGGSQGSHNINLAFLKALSMSFESYKYQVIHISGREDLASMEKGYKNLTITARVFDFLKEIDLAYSACDLVVSRAGATTLSELIYFRLPAVLIPYPFAHKHQSENARFLEKEGSAVLIEEEKLDMIFFNQTLSEFMHNPDKIKIMRESFDKVITRSESGSDLLVREVLDLGGKLLK